jgi:acetylornithine deacetylase/succinyl-diaminopimelate desuccinylase-like protein
VAEIILEAMQQLNYDEVRTDAAGNVIGLIKGGNGPTTLFNGHMDVVDAGKSEDWQFPPFSAEINKGYMWGRGSADMKCALAGMLFAAGLFKQWDHQPQGDVVVVAVSMEEIGGWGTHLWLENSDLRVDRAVVGEPTNNHLLPGHRVRMALKAHIRGKSMHSSQANHQTNPLFSLARFIDALPGVTASLSERVGYLTIIPTTAICSPAEASNITHLT